MYLSNKCLALFFDESWKPVKKRVADQLGKEQAQGKLDNARDSKRSEKVDRLILLRLVMEMRVGFSYHNTLEKR